jgi:tetratricopeptide (TPR) repeat protein
MHSFEKSLTKNIVFFHSNRVKRFLLCFLLLASGLLQAQPAEIKKVFNHIESEQPGRALAMLKDFSKGPKISPNQQYYIGMAHLRLGNLDEALKAFEDGIALKEKYGLNYAGKAHVKFLRGQPNEAAPLLERALDLGRNKDAEIFTAAAAAYLVDPKLAAKAIELLEKARSLNSDNRETHLLLGDAYLIKNKGGESVSSYERAAKVDQYWGMPHYKIAAVYGRSRNDEMVFLSLSKAISADSLFAPAHKKLGEMYYVRKQADKAVREYEKYLSITENPGDATFQYAFFLIMAKQFDKANAIFEKVIHSDNVPPLALKYYAFSLLEQDTARKNAEQARPLLEKYISLLKPAEVQAADYAYYGKVLLKLGEDSLASQSFTNSLEIDSAQQDILVLHARNLMKQKRYAEAAEVYSQMVQMDESPKLQDLWYLGQAYYYDEQYVNADSAFSKMLSKQSADKLPFQVLLLSARSKANIDSTMTTGLAKPMYEAFLERISPNVSKYPKEAIEGYSYLGAYYVHKEENLAKAKSYYEKILKLDSDNPMANGFMKAISEQGQKKGG